ncbi:MAG: DUF456 domain-containing protein [Actinobacteria bacterium]|nr:DUF456 domain-containing protein [Actinomycetota bacterium]MCI0545226.1 DUF456 domain-containing protein [Actinomycetota bacterium]MCI0678969.1 DUF456 domain-containing protein [Actinomycetota bacterium]
MALHDLAAGIGILIGLVGVVVVVVPGLLIVVGAVVLWAVVEQTPLGWVVMLLALAIGGVASILKYLHPGRRLKEIGIPVSHLLLAVGVGVVGMFVLPFLGAFIGFAATIYLLERSRGGGEQARISTIATLRAVALSIGIELAGGFLITVVWVAAVIWG